MIFEVFQMAQRTHFIAMMLAPLAVAIGVIAAIFGIATFMKSKNENASAKEKASNEPQEIVYLPAPSHPYTVSTRQMWKQGAIIGTCVFVALALVKILI